MIQSPVNNVLLKIGNIFLKKPSDIVLTSAAYSPDATINPADLVQIVGEVVAVPKSITNHKFSYEGFSTKDIRVGDTAIFRYDVIYSFTGKNSRYKNLFYYRQKEYWVADIQKIFAVIRKGEIIMVNGYCMIENVTPTTSLFLPKHLKQLLQIGTATLTNIGNNLSHLPRINAQPGDTVFYNPSIAQKYEIAGRPFGIIRQRDVFGVAVGDYNPLV